LEARITTGVETFKFNKTIKKYKKDIVAYSYWSIKVLILPIFVTHRMNCGVISIKELFIS
jgi:hypothetical protein